MEIIFELLAELILQIVGELLAELGLRSVRETVKRPANPVIASIGYTILGAAAGGVSLLVHAQHFTETMELRIAAVVLVPLAAGGAMALLGAWRRRRNEPLIRIDNFMYGYLFALAMALVRFFFAE